jgi:ABC-2 type transport system permease protein
MQPASLAWFARHELRLAWRDFMSMMTAGRRRKTYQVALVFTIAAALLHLIAYAIVARFAPIGPQADKTTLLVVTGSALLAWSLMLSQAMESVTRAFYARADLDLILSSPAQARRLFAIRIGAIAVTTAAMAALLAGPFINVLAVIGGARWLAAYGVILALSAVAAAVAVALTVALFRMIGPRRTRLVAQIVAAVIGAAFVIGLQAAAILSHGTLSRIAVLQEASVVARTPDPDSFVWWPARAILGDPVALAGLLAASLALIGAAAAVFSRRFGEHAVAAGGLAPPAVARPRRTAFQALTPRRALRRKEWVLLARDPWLMSQTLMQILYLLPPALLLWRSFADGIGAMVLLVPVLVMAAGQLAGGLAWLAISGEDAPDLVASAPVAAARILAAKVEAVMGGIALVFLPLALTMALASPLDALICALGIALAALAATLIQLAFRTEARRSHFRRRHTASRVATFAEAFSSITWASTAGLAAAGTWFAVIPGLAALGILGGVRLLSPQRS